MAKWIEPDPILREVPDTIVTLDLSAGEHPEKGFKLIRSLQRFEDYKQGLSDVMRKVKALAQKEHWKPFCYYGVVSNRHLSDKETGEELGANNSRICNWHIHMIFYSETASLEDVRHYANMARYYWVGFERSKKNGKDKGGYNLGANNPQFNPYAESGAILKWYYTKYQAHNDNYTCAKWDGKKFTMMKKPDFLDLMEKEWEKLTPEQKERAEKRRAKWRTRSRECDEVIDHNEKLMINLLATPMDYILTELEQNGIDSTGVKATHHKDSFVQGLLRKHRGDFSSVVQGTNTEGQIEYGVTGKQYALAVVLGGINAGAIIRTLMDRAEINLLDRVRQYLLYNIELDGVDKDGVTWIVEKGKESAIDRVTNSTDRQGYTEIE